MYLTGITYFNQTWHTTLHDFTFNKQSLKQLLPGLVTANSSVVYLVLLLFSDKGGCVGIQRAPVWCAGWFWLFCLKCDVEAGICAPQLEQTV